MTNKPVATTTTAMMSAMATAAAVASPIKFVGATAINAVPLASATLPYLHHDVIIDATSLMPTSSFLYSIPRGGAASKEDVAASESASENDKRNHRHKDSLDDQRAARLKKGNNNNSKKKNKSSNNRRRATTTSTTPDEQDDPTTKDDLRNNLQESTPSSSTSSSSFSSRRGSSSSSSSSRNDGDKDTEANNSDGSAATTSTNASSSNNHHHHHSKINMSPHQEKIVHEILQEDDYYKILGTSREATSNEIQKAYRKRAVLTHPDKMPNGDRRAFDKVAEAYDVLSDDTKRKQYNQFGKVGGGVAPSSAEELFRSFFSSSHHHHPFFSRGSSSAASKRQRRNRNVRYQLEVTLEELYNGLTKSVLVSQPPTTTPFGPFQLHNNQQQQPLKRKRVEVHIPAGSFSGQSIVLSGEMDWDQEQTPADIVFIIVQRPHPVFTRKGYDLAMELTITLEEAISGVHRSITHLDGRNIVIESAAHTIRHGHPHQHHPQTADDHDSDKNDSVPLIIQSGSVQVLKGEGMPKRNGKGHGDLYIQYKVDMPSSLATRQHLTPTEREELQRLLSKLQKNTSQKSKHSSFWHAQPSSNDNNNVLKQQQQQQQQQVRILEPATAADFGRNGPDPRDEEHHDAATQEEDHDDVDAMGGFRAFPFGSSGGRQFFFSSSSDSHPFFREDWKEDGNGNVQCQQM